MEVRIDGVRYGPIPSPSVGNGTLAEILAAYRNLSGLSLNKASCQARISKTYLFEMESGTAIDPSFVILVRLARLYGIGLESLADAIVVRGEP